MKQILEIPAGLTTAQLNELVNDRIRDINEAFRTTVENPAEPQQDLDVSLNRVVNLADPKNDLDAVNLRSLKRLAVATEPVTVEQSIVQTEVTDVVTFIFGSSGAGSVDGPGVVDVVLNATTNLPMLDGVDASTQWEFVHWDANLASAARGSAVHIDIKIKPFADLPGVPSFTIFASSPVVIPANTTAVVTGSGFKPGLIGHLRDKLQGIVTKVGSVAFGRGATVQLYLRRIK